MTAGSYQLPLTMQKTAGAVTLAALVVDHGAMPRRRFRYFCQLLTSSS